MRVADLMRRNVKFISPDATVAELVVALADAHVSGLPVVDDRGRMIGVNGPDVVDDGLLRRSDKPCLAYDHLNDVHGFPDALVQAYAEGSGEVIEGQVPAVERLQHQDLFDRRLSVARRRTDHQQAPQQRTLQSGANAAIRTRSACRRPGVLRSDGVAGAA